MSILRCKICDKLIKRSKMLMKVYPEDYDFSACNACNAEASNED